MSSATAIEGPNTLTLVARAHLMLSRQVTEGVTRAGYPAKPSYSAVFGQIHAEGSRLTDMAKAANVTPQAMGELVDELEALGHLTRVPDPSDRRAKLIQLTESGRDYVTAGLDMVTHIERQITATLGEHGHRELRQMLTLLLEQLDTQRAAGPTTRLLAAPNRDPQQYSQHWSTATHD